MHLSFNNHLKFYGYLKTLDENIDVNKSLNLCYRGAPTWIAYQDGSKKQFKNTVELLEFLNETLGTNIDTTRSLFTLTTTLIFFKEEVVKMVEDEESITEEAVEIHNTLDKELIEGFKELSTKKAKDALAKYSLETFDIKLKKNTTFEKMLDTLEASL